MAIACLKCDERGRDRFFGELVQLLHALNEVIEGPKARRPGSRRALARGFAQPAAIGGPQRADDHLGDLVHDRKEIVHTTIVSLGPQVLAGRSLDQLRGHPDAVAASLDAALEE